MQGEFNTFALCCILKTLHIRAVQWGLSSSTCIVFLIPQLSIIISLLATQGVKS